MIGPQRVGESRAALQDGKKRATFPGRIVVVDSREGLSALVAELRGVPMVGFDTESRPSFRRGQSNAVCLVQLATADRAWLVRLHLLDDLTPLLGIMASPELLKVGLSLRNDVLALQRRLGEFPMRGLVDLQLMAPRLGLAEQSLRGLTDRIFGEWVSKSSRLTNWEAEQLSESQRLYAATDAWLCYRLAMRGPFRALLESDGLLEESHGR